jgi:hypothetical protein
MKSLVITPRTQEESKLINSLLKQLGITPSKISVEEMEDLTLAKLMSKVDKSKKVTKDEIFQKLNGK